MSSELPLAIFKDIISVESITSENFGTNGIQGDIKVDSVTAGIITARTNLVCLTVSDETLSYKTPDRGNSGDVLTSNGTGTVSWQPTPIGFNPNSVETFTNKTITDTSNSVAAGKLHSATTIIDVVSATAPTSGQVLTATSGTSATWQTPSGGGESSSPEYLGRTWVKYEITDENRYGGAYSPSLNRGVIIGEDKVWYTSDGIAWISSTTGIHAYDWKKIIWNPDRGEFIMATANGTLGVNPILVSPDGITWTSASDVYNGNEIYGGLTWASTFGTNGLYFLSSVNNSNDNHLQTSPDGIVWTAVAASVTDFWSHLVFMSNTNRLVGSNGSGTATSLASSTDGITWNYANDADKNVWVSLQYSPKLGMMLAGGAFGAYDMVGTTTDGLTWTFSEDKIECTPADSYSWSDSLQLFFVKATFPNNNPHYISIDGVTWQPYYNTDMLRAGPVNFSLKDRHVIITGNDRSLQHSFVSTIYNIGPHVLSSSILKLPIWGNGMSEHSQFKQVGSLVYNINTSTVQVYNGTSWVDV